MRRRRKPGAHLLSGEKKPVDFHALWSASGGTGICAGGLSMYAAVPETGSLTISQTITNKELYLANQTQCDNDYENFKLEVNKLLKSEQQTVDLNTTDTITE